MEGIGHSPDIPQGYPQYPVPNLEGVNNDGHTAAPSAVPAAEAVASASQDEEPQEVPAVPGWKPEWVRFLKTRGNLTLLGDDSRHAYTFPQITDLLHGEFGIETHTLTMNDLIDVWKTHIGPSLTKDRKGKSRMHESEIPEETNVPSGGANGYPQYGNGSQHGTPDDYPGGIHHAAPPYAYATGRNGQSSLHQGCGAYNSGASSSREGPQAWYLDPRRDSQDAERIRLRNLPRRATQSLPQLRSLDIWYLGRGNGHHRASSRTGNSNREQRPTRAAAGYGASRIPAPRSASAAAHHEVFHPQPLRYISGHLLSIQDGGGSPKWDEQGFPRDARR